ncbi:MAG: hypothetical protein E6023_30330 [Pseudomonas aeruginosa]|nr:hypothetical protein [Pseudomonas aeruginosa]
MKDDWQKAYERFLAEIKHSAGKIAPVYFDMAVKHADAVIESLAKAERLKGRSTL